MASIVVSGDTSGSVTISAPAVAGSTTLTLPSITGGTILSATSLGTSGQVLTSNGAASLPTFQAAPSPQTGFKNRIINGGFLLDQRNSGASQTITAAAALAYTADRWYAYCTGANVTGQRVAGAYTSSQYRYQFTGAASVTAIGFGQRIEAVNSYDLANTTATLSCYISNSLLTTVTWTAYYANTTDTFGTLASPTVTQIATGTFTVSSTRTQYTTNISIPSAATTGIQIVFTVGAQTSGTWIVDTIQLEAGSAATTYEFRSITQELALCQRYYELGSYGNSGYVNQAYQMSSWVNFKVTKRTSPTMTASNFNSLGATSGYGGSNYTNVNGFQPIVSWSVNSVGGGYGDWSASAEL